MSDTLGAVLLGSAPAGFRVTRKYIEGNGAIHLVPPRSEPNYQTLLLGQELCLSYYTGSSKRCVCALILDNEAEYSLYLKVFEEMASNLDYGLDFASMSDALNEIFQELLLLKKQE